MKKIIILYLIFLFSILIYSCNLFSGITYSEAEDVYYVTEQTGKLFKCKKINKKMYCVEIALRDID